MRLNNRRSTEEWKPKVVRKAGGGFTVIYPFGTVDIKPDASRYLKPTKKVRP